MPPTEETIEVSTGNAKAAPKQVPSIGRVVHYVSYGTPGGEYLPLHRAAVITEVLEDGGVCLCVMNPTGLFFNRGVRFDSSGSGPGTWHWPEYVPAK